MAELIEGVVFSLVAQNPTTPIKPVHDIDKPQTTVGRHPSSDLALPFESVSRHHARMELRGTEIYVVDLGSSNGTYINQKRVTEGILRDGDLVSFGNLTFIFHRRDAAAAGDDPDSITHTRTGGVRVVARDDAALQTVVQKMAKSDTTASRTFPAEITDAASLDRARRLLSTIYEFHKHLGSKTEESEIFQTTLNLIFDALPCERGVILAREDEECDFQPVQMKVRGREAGSDDIAISQTIIDRCLADRVAILSRDAMADSRFGGAHSIMMHDIRSAMCAPMMSRERVLAICFVDTSEATRTFGEDDLAFFASLAAEVAILIDNARMRREMIRSEQMAAIGQTITGMAHNVKNILLLSQGGIGLLDTCLEQQNYEAVDKTWVLIKKGLDRINSLVHEMLDFARQRPVVRRTASVNAIIQETIDFVAKDLAEKDIQLDLHLDEHVPDCLLDDQGFYKAFLNLLVNASEAVESGTGRLEVATRLDDDGVIRIKVEDNGSGIPAEHLQRIFQPFFTTKGSKGTGLGLAMTRKIIEAMGGRIHCRSEEGAGTQFEITIRPMIAEGAETSVEEDTAKPAGE